MAIGEKRALRLLLIVLVVFVIAVAANGLMDFGAVIHDLTHSH